MKKLKIALIALVVIVPIAIYLIASQANSYLKKNKDVIEAQASKALGTPVKLGEIDLKVFPNAIINLDHISIGKTETSSGLSVNQVKVNIALLKLFSKQLYIEEISVDQPEIVIARTASGIIIPGLPQKKPEDSAKAGKEIKQKDTASTELPKSLPIDIVLKRLALNNASINFIDKVSKQNLQIQPINFSTGLGSNDNVINLTDLSLAADIANITPINISSKVITLNLKDGKATIPELVAAALKTNIKVVGDLNIQTQQGEFQISANQSDLSAVLTAAKEFIKSPALAVLKVGGQINTDLNAKLLENQALSAAGGITLKDVSANQGIINLNNLNGRIGLSASLRTAIKATLQSDNLSLKLKDSPVQLAFKAALNAEDFQLSNTQVNLFGGVANLTAKHNLKTKSLSSDLEVINLDLSQLHQAVDIPALKAFEGTLSSFNLISGGSLKALPASIIANGDVKLVNGALKGTNLAATVLSVIKDLPFLTGSLLDVAPEELSGDLNAEDTAIREFTAKFGLTNSVLNIVSMELFSTIFDLTASGNIGLDQSLDLKAEITFNQSFSQALANKTKEVKNLLSKDGRLILPIQIKGKVGKILIIPDLKRLLEIGALNAVQNKVKDKINEKLSEKTKGIFNKLGF